jgi:hypothetical protein
MRYRVPDGIALVSTATGIQPNDPRRNTTMMKQCCDDDGKPDFEKMKQFMKRCCEERLGDDKMRIMKQICCQEGMPDADKMKELMKRCGCRPS